jgi:FkbM family methyltransferase
MIRRAIKRALGVALPRFRTPKRAGFIALRDEVSGKVLRMYWREDTMMETLFYRYGLYGSWERHSLKIWAHACRDAGEILDIGANTGVFSLLARCNNEKARIVAVEPIALNAEILQANIDENRAEVEVELSAMSESDGVAKMYMLRDQLNYMTAVDDDRYARHPEIVRGAEVVETVVRLQSWPSIRDRLRLSGPALIKVDVEGHEVAVIRSMMDHIRLNVPTLLIEIIGDENASTIQALLMDVPYRKFAINESAGRAWEVEKLWDNDHQNFLLCDERVACRLASGRLLELSKHATS